MPIWCCMSLSLPKVPSNLRHKIHESCYIQKERFFFLNLYIFISFQVRTMFIVSSLFSLFWFPYSVVCILEHVIFVPPGWVRYVGWLGMANSCANSIVLSIANKNYQTAFKRVLFCSSCRKPGKTHVIPLRETSTHIM